MEVRAWADRTMIARCSVTLLYTLYRNLNHSPELACTLGNLLDKRDVLGTSRDAGGRGIIRGKRRTQPDKYCYKTTQDVSGK